MRFPTVLLFTLTCVAPSLGFSTTASTQRSPHARSRSLVTRVESSTPAIPSSAVIDESLFLDEADALSKLDFPLSEVELTTKVKEFLSAGQGVERPELLAEEFSFMGPVVGGSSGLDREAYLEAVGGFKIKDAFPDLNPRFHHFRADPLDAGRIWFTSVASGTDNGKGFLGNKPTGKSFMTPPQACSLKFNNEGKAIKYTIGHVMERSLGNTGGLGGIFGPAYAIGKALPFPEAQPYKPSKRYRMIQLIGRIASSLKKKE
eukprot:CAMPEP_0201884956 /NCGR_PEP_ID=MMETSP0902-20130614/17643_1 /ASSEMBLY_ACC=CAM_ASM_000551 /TAXON_ID=420261 /ORGANISM="Thalassiosira antarctica, Strain CCMP982" /LENGTH=259 /DNA_ID=CAMNT_0048413977 /DNA_START=32 /DNA_END=811 /DNA_ORIENTATION=+